MFYPSSVKQEVKVNGRQQDVFQLFVSTMAKWSATWWWSRPPISTRETDGPCVPWTVRECYSGIRNPYYLGRQCTVRYIKRGIAPL